MFTCSGEVISPTAVLTVAHCFDHPSYSYGIFTDADASAYSTLDALIPHLTPLANVYMHPQYDRATPFTADIGVGVLVAPTTIPALPFVRDTSTAGLAGTTARIVGYGQTVYNTFNAIRHQATTTVAAVDAGDTITVGDGTHLTCVGDSGGPALIASGGVERVVGVDSYTDTTGCTQPAHFRETAIYASFIDQYAGTSAGGGADAGVGSDYVEAGSPQPTSHSGGGCAASGDASSGGSLVLALGLVIALRRRTRPTNR